MKLLSLKLRGAIGIQKGLSKDEVEINFADFNSGLIALTGKNGSGKTTIMENLHPYRCMVSRSGSLQSHFFLKDSYRILEFEHEGVSYESKILIDALTGGSEAYLTAYQIGGDGVQPLNDGKLTTYDEAIENLLGSQELFFNSVFSGQKSKGIAELKPADRRKLFYELLNLNIYESYLDKAKAELKNAEIKLAEAEANIKAVSENTESKENVLFDKNNALESRVESIKEIKRIEEEILNCQNTLNEQEVNKRLLQNQLADQSRIEDKLKQNGDEIDQLSDSLNSKILKLESEIKEAKALVDLYRKTLDQKEKIAASLIHVEEVELSISENRKKYTELQETKTELQKKHNENLKTQHELHNTWQTLQTKYNKLVREEQLMQEGILKVQSEAEIIDQVPCGNKDSIISKYDFSSCQFLKNAFAGRAKLPEMKETHNQHGLEVIRTSEETEKAFNKYEELKQHVEDDYNTAIEGIITTESKLNNEFELLQSTLKDFNKPNLIKAKENADKAESAIEIQNQKISTNEKLIVEARENFDSNLRRIQNESEDLQSKIDPELQIKLDQIFEEVNKYSTQQIDLKSDLTKNKTDVENAEKALAICERELKQLEENEKKVEKIKAEIGSIQNEIKDWTFLCKAFDKTGIPVLKLENSGVEITSIANDLLSLFENRFSIVFETTSLTRDKKKVKETFDINVVEEAGVTEISNKSGGQQVQIETALRLAIAHVVRKQGKNLQTAFLDEADGALDLDNAVNYLTMIQNAHKLSGVQNTFIITHRTELLDMIPQQVVLSDGLFTILN